MEAGQIIGQDDKKIAQPPNQLVRDSLDELLKVGGWEVGRKLPHSLHEGVGPDLAILGIGSRDDLQHWTWTIAEHLVMGPGVGLDVTLTEKMEDRDANVGLLGDPVSLISS